MQIQNNISLKPFNTFGIDVTAKFFCEINSTEDLYKALHLNEHPHKFILSGGSNMLFTKDIEALVLHINLKGIEIVSEDKDHAIVKVMAGENWHQMILWTLAKNYGGLENMSLIPGNTGTAPIQNIGAYGIELKDLFVNCEALHIKTLKIKYFNKEACQFGYRDSYFKNSGKGEYIITSVTLKLTKRNHNISTSYGAIEDELKTNNINTPTIKDVSNAVIAIRKRKLPDPKILGNSGSFFKNPLLSKAEFTVITQNHADIPFYKISEDSYKIPAGWLIEQCDFKGKRIGDAGVHRNQALVLVNYGSATGEDILNLADSIIKGVKKRFGIQIIPEVNIIK